jgi:hypothetical protein
LTIRDLLAKRSGAIDTALGWHAELGANRRVMAGLLIIVTLAAVYSLVLLHHASETMRQSYVREMQHLQRVVAVAGERDWQHRAETSAGVLGALRERLWHAESDGVARANIQDWAIALGREVGLDVLEVRTEVAQPKLLPPDVRQITANITAQPSETALIALLARIEQAPHLGVIDRLNVRQQPGPLLEMVLVSYAKIAAKAEPAGHETSQ